MIFNEISAINRFKLKLLEIGRKITYQMCDIKLPEKTWEDYTPNCEHLMIDFAEPRIRVLLTLQKLLSDGLIVINEAKNNSVLQSEENQAKIEIEKRLFITAFHTRAKIYLIIIASELQDDLPEVEYGENLTHRIRQCVSLVI